VFMYKGFSLSMMNTHLMRGLTKKYNGKYDAKYLMALVTMTTIMGGLSLQLKEIAKGKEPRDWQDPKFFTAAMIQGGGLGIFGDFIYTGIEGQSRHGHGLLMTMLGPKLGFMSDTTKVPFAAASDIINGEFTVGKEAVKYLTKYAPYGTLWQTRLIMERMLKDNLLEAVDPNAKKNWRRYEKKVKQEYDQEYWWRRGDSAPRF